MSARKLYCNMIYSCLNTFFSLSCYNSMEDVFPLESSLYLLMYIEVRVDSHANPYKMLVLSYPVSFNGLLCKAK